MFVKAGSILPVGPKIQYTAEKKWDNIEIRIYEGANGRFTLYEDEGDNYNYETGSYSTIIFTWNDTGKILTISDRKGSFPDMPAERKFCVVVVTKDKGTGMNQTKKYDKQIVYSGKKLRLNCN